MAKEQRLIDAMRLVTKLAKRVRFGRIEYDDASAVIAEAPTVDAVEVVHGRWIPVDGEGEPCDEWDCSICERRLTFGEEMETDEVYELNHYCPNCGAKMDGENDV